MATLSPPAPSLPGATHQPLAAHQPGPAHQSGPAQQAGAARPAAAVHLSAASQPAIPDRSGVGRENGPLGDQALVAKMQAGESAAIVLTAQVGRLPVELDVGVPVRNFRVRNLLTLEPSSLVESGWGHGEDVPLSAGAVQLAWCEFEVIDTDLAVRVTRLA